MSTDNNRGRYDRSKLRYPSDLTDDEWRLVEPLISTSMTSVELSLRATRKDGFHGHDKHPELESLFEIDKGSAAAAIDG